MKTIFESYKTGLEISWQHKRAVFFLYGINLLFAYLMSLPFSAMLEQAMDYTAMADRLLQAFDLTAVVTLFEDYGRGTDLGWHILVFVILYLLLNTFFSAGVIRMMTRQNNFKVREFLNDCLEFFSRFFRLFLLTMGLLVAVFVLYLMITRLAGMLTKNAVTEIVPFLLFISKITFFGLLVAWLNMVIDYTKIHMVIHDTGGAYRSLRYALGFVFRNFVKTSGLYGLLMVTGLVFLLVYLGVEYYIPKHLAVGAALFFVVSQMYIFLRVWLRLVFYGGQMVLYE